MITLHPSTRSRVLLAAFATLVVIADRPRIATGEERPAAAACAETTTYSKLDFWIGTWEVLSEGEKVGDNRIEKILAGCAVLEHWTSVSGSSGKSLFYYLPAEAAWKQVWITEMATQPGGTKEKRLIEETADGGLVFRGEISLPGGGSYLDQTTLRPLPGGDVSQVIAISRDGGGSWQTVFDAIYTRQPPAAAVPETGGGRDGAP